MSEESPQVNSPSLLDQYIASREEEQRNQQTTMEQRARRSRQQQHQEQSPHNGTQDPGTSHPSAQLTENSRGLRLCLDLPGVNAGDIEVTIQHGILDIRGVRKTYNMNGTAVVKKMKFARKFSIDTSVVDVCQAKANLSKGVLVVTAPKNEKPARICVPVTEESDEEWTGSQQHTVSPSEMQGDESQSGGQEQGQTEGDTSAVVRPDYAGSGAVPVEMEVQPSLSGESETRARVKN